MKKFSYKFLLTLVGITVALSTLSRVQATSHVVEEGDSMFSIAEQYGVDPYQLAEVNAMEIDGLITPGQGLELPAGSHEEVSVASQSTIASQSGYVVQDENSFYGIADAFSLDIKLLLGQVTGGEMQFLGEPMRRVMLSI